MILSGLKTAQALCPICQGSGEEVFRVSDIPVVNCADCDHRFAGLKVDESHTLRTFGDEYFTHGDHGYTDYLADGKSVLEVGRRYAKLMSRHTAAGRMLDVGAAAGFVMKGFHEHGWEVMGLEPNATMASEARNQFGFEVLAETMENNSLHGKFDLINMTQVVAHFNDTRLAFEQAAELTADRGYWLIETWNYRSLTARAFGRMWHEYCPPSVTQWFTPTSLRKLAEQFEMVQVAQGRPRKVIGGEHARSLLAYTMKRVGLGFLNPCARIIPANMVLPYPGEDAFWMLLQRK